MFSPPAVSLISPCLVVTVCPPKPENTPSTPKILLLGIALWMWAVIGGGGLVVVLLLAILIFCLCRRVRRRRVSQ